jgi:hypothetical protein
MFNLSFELGLINRGFLCNTWGLNSINSDTFSNRRDGHHTFDLLPLLCVLKVSTFALDVLGYIPGVASISGGLRLGGALLGGALVELGIKAKLIIGPYVAEARGTIRAQALRGILEMIPFYGQVVNGTLDLLHTPTNLVREWRILTNPYYAIGFHDEG